MGLPPVPERPPAPGLSDSYYAYFPKPCFEVGRAEECLEIENSFCFLGVLNETNRTTGTDAGCACQSMWGARGFHCDQPSAAAWVAVLGMGCNVALGVYASCLAVQCIRQLLALGKRGNNILFRTATGTSLAWCALGSFASIVWMLLELLGTALVDKRYHDSKGWAAIVVAYCIITASLTISISWIEVVRQSSAGIKAKTGKLSRWAKNTVAALVLVLCAFLLIAVVSRKNNLLVVVLTLYIVGIIASFTTSAIKLKKLIRKVADARAKRQRSTAARTFEGSINRIIRAASSIVACCVGSALSMIVALVSYGGDDGATYPGEAVVKVTTTFVIMIKTFLIFGIISLLTYIKSAVGS